MDDYMPSRYQLLGRIGEGVHGVVVKARDLQSDDKMVAIKKLSLRTKFGVISLNTVREIRALQHCRCDNVSIPFGRKYTNTHLLIAIGWLIGCHSDEVRTFMLQALGFCS